MFRGVVAHSHVFIASGHFVLCDSTGLIGQQCRNWVVKAAARCAALLCHVAAVACPPTLHQSAMAADAAALQTWVHSFAAATVEANHHTTPLTGHPPCSRLAAASGGLMAACYYCLCDCRCGFYHLQSPHQLLVIWCSAAMGQSCDAEVVYPERPQ